MITPSINEQIVNDPHIKGLVELKERLISSHPPKMLFNLVTGDMEYVIEDERIKKIDEHIELRVKQIIDLNYEGNRIK